MRLSFEELVDGTTDAARNRAAAKGVVTQLSGRLVQAAIQMVAFIVISRLLGPNEVGIAALAMSVVALPGAIRELGFAVPTTRRAQITESMVTSLFWLGLAVSLGIGALVAAISPIVGFVYADDRVAKACIVLAIEIAVSGLVIQHSALLRRSFRNGKLVLVQLLSESGALVLGVVLALQGAGYLAIVGRVLAFQVVRVAVIWFFVDWRPGRPSFSENARAAAREGGTVGAFEFANYFSRNADDLLIGWRWGTEQLGLYRRSYDLLMIPLRLVSVPVAQIALPLLGQSTGNDRNYQDNWRRLLDLLVVLTVPIAVILFLYPADVLGVLLGEDWTEAAPILRWMAPLALLQPIVASVGWVMLSQGRARAHLRVGVANSCITVCAFVLALSSGPTAVAATYTIVNVVVTIPIALTAATRSGAVSLRHYVDLLGRAAVGAFVVGGVLQLSAGNAGSFVALLLIGAAALVLNIAVLSMLPNGRQRMRALRTLGATDDISKSA